VTPPSSVGHNQGAHSGYIRVPSRQAPKNGPSTRAPESVHHRACSGRVTPDACSQIIGFNHKSKHPLRCSPLCKLRVSKKTKPPLLLRYGDLSGPLIQSVYKQGKLLMSKLKPRGTLWAQQNRLQTASPPPGLGCNSKGPQNPSKAQQGDPCRQGDLPGASPSVEVQPALPKGQGPPPLQPVRPAQLST